MTLEAAAAALGLDVPPASASAVYAAWREAVTAAHPDLGGHGDLDHLKACRDRLLEKRPCAKCGGSGRLDVTSGFHATNVPCQRCLGQGTVALRP